MTANVPRLRIFAGPNGSGKSTIKSVLSEELLGIYINPDEIEKEISRKKLLPLDRFHVAFNPNDLLTFFQESELLKNKGLLGNIKDLNFDNKNFNFQNVKMNAYFASVIADFIRKKLMECRRSFTFETVLSSQDKITLLEKAQKLGYRTYLYYVATEDPEINISRVSHRVNMGGHFVPEDKIVSRYHRSLALLWDAIHHTNRAYIFDNSGSEKVWLAKITNRSEIEIKSELIPAWFENAVLKKV